MQLGSRTDVTSRHRTLAVAIALCLAGAAASTGGQGASGDTEAACVGVREIGLPPVVGADAIWGSLGSDARGHIFLGVSVRHANPKSAVLLEFDPDANLVSRRGDVLAALAAAG